MKCLNWYTSSWFISLRRLFFCSCVCALLLSCTLPVTQNRFEVISLNRVYLEEHRTFADFVAIMGSLHVMVANVSNMSAYSVMGQMLLSATAPLLPV